MASSCTLVLFFNILELKLNRSVTYFGHIHTQDLSDNEDITSCQKDFCCKANCKLHTLPSYSIVFAGFCKAVLCGHPLLLKCTILRSLSATSYRRSGGSFETVTPESSIWLLDYIVFIILLSSGHLGLYISAALKPQFPLLAAVYTQTCVVF